MRLVAGQRTDEVVERCYEPGPDQSRKTADDALRKTSMRPKMLLNEAGGNDDVVVDENHDTPPGLAKSGIARRSRAAIRLPDAAEREGRCRR